MAERKRNNGYLAGHGIPFEGRAMELRGGRPSRTFTAEGRTRCACGEWSPELPSDSARRRWRTAHKATVGAAAQ